MINRSGEGYGIDYDEKGYATYFSNPWGNGQGDGSYSFLPDRTGKHDLICGFQNIFDGKPCYSVILMGSEYHVG